MKLIEKLAEDYNKGRPENFVSTFTNQESYAAGFRKAREMAAEKVRPCFDALIRRGMITNDQAHAMIRALGEEEVNE